MLQLKNSKCDKTQNVTKLKKSKCDKTHTTKCDKKMWQLNKSKCDEPQQLKKNYHSKIFSVKQKKF